MTTTSQRRPRLLLKLSGESLAERGGYGIDHDRLSFVAGEVADATRHGADIAVVVGGGNLVRGADLASAGDIDRVTADHMGMLGTMMNAIALADKLRILGIDALALSSIGLPGVIQHFERDAARKMLDSGRTLVLGGGTGNPFFTTDTTAALRAAQLGCSEILKATKVDGVYTDDPMTNPDATRYDRLTFCDAIEKQLKVMDATSFAMCRENGIAVRVFRFDEPGNIAAVVAGEPIGTVVSP
ncbi:MAG: UMP kinase [Phycisphaerae bacterium]|nr:UMP kinase [Phycisphaerae bacterium]